jgi:hypothetical protein
MLKMEFHPFGTISHFIRPAVNGLTKQDNKIPPTIVISNSLIAVSVYNSRFNIVVNPVTPKIEIIIAASQKMITENTKIIEPA